MSNQKFESQIKIFYNTMKKYEEKGDTQMACNNQLMAYGYIIGSYDAGVITEEEKNEAEHLMGFRSNDNES